MTENNKYTQEQMDIALLKNTNEGILRTLDSIQSEMKGQFYFMVGAILGLYLGLGTLIVSKVWGL